MNSRPNFAVHPASVNSTVCVRWEREYSRPSVRQKVECRRRVSWRSTSRCAMRFDNTLGVFSVDRVASESRRCRVRTNCIASAAGVWLTVTGWSESQRRYVNVNLVNLQRRPTDKSTAFIWWYILDGDTTVTQVPIQIAMCVADERWKPKKGLIILEQCLNLQKENSLLE